MDMAYDINKFDLVQAIKAEKTLNGRKKEYLCPYCGHEVILKKGDIREHHFACCNEDCKMHTLNKRGAHKSTINLSGESATHLEMKRVVGEILKRDNVFLHAEYEYKIGDYIADFFISLYDDEGNIVDVAVECIHRHLDIYNFREKLEFYYKNNIFLLCFFDHYIFEKDRCRWTEILNDCHIIYFNKIYVVDVETEELYVANLTGILYNVVDPESGRTHLVQKKGYRDIGFKKIIKKFCINFFRRVDQEGSWEFNQYPHKRAVAGISKKTII